MSQVYMVPSTDYCGSPMSFANVPDLVSSYDDISTDPSPSPPVVSNLSIEVPRCKPLTLKQKMFSTLDNQYHPYTATSAFPDYLRSQQQHATPQPSIVNSIEFTDLTQINHDDSSRRRRRSTTAQDKEAATNMRIRRRAQNRASQRAFRERKEKHVQHLEHELEQLEAKHQNLEKSYTEVEGAHNKLQDEVETLKDELARYRENSASNSREGSVSESSSSRHSQPQFKIEENPHKTDMFDPFAPDGFFAHNSGELGF
ncbi:uncharacterized protein KY384_008263 [Bacidia gigantensis]|uniref:uncharacterized protein n=1 Tax=Bacidia gigantensis TaxID=2732470 RepID=UPI001D03F15A|nr:uncharacterized protein KY384_008263 [Bacidia gigantensis]KAG8526834.1 hypothetical protein KY384_008263 [Bacidia gigantensis]